MQAFGDGNAALPHFIGGGQQVRHHDRHHAGRMGRAHAVVRVLQRQAVGRVGAETRYWREGEAFVFDDTIEHEAANPSGELRVVLIFDVWHPDLSRTEREAVAAAIASQGLEDQAL